MSDCDTDCAALNISSCTLLEHTAPHLVGKQVVEEEGSVADRGKEECPYSHGRWTCSQALAAMPKPSSRLALLES